MNDGLRWVVTQFHLDTRFVDAMPFSYMKPLSGSGSKAMMIYFFSSRRRHTIYWRDWSSDVCSSDLVEQVRHQLPQQAIVGVDRHVGLQVRLEPHLETGRHHRDGSHALFDDLVHVHLASRQPRPSGIRSREQEHVFHHPAEARALLVHDRQRVAVFPFLTRLPLERDFRGGLNDGD